MINLLKSSAAVVALGLCVGALPGVASSMPLDKGVATESVASSDIQQVRWRGGWGFGAGFLGGALVGSALAAPYYYGPGPYYYGGPYYGPYAGPAYGYYGSAYSGDPVAYCAQRFRSYDPSTGTYMGFDGRRHPCP